MLRSIRRQLRAWKEDFLRYWRRLRSFHRVALAILLAMVIVPFARRYALDPLQTEIAETRAALQEQEAPVLVTLPDDDPEVVELLMQVESLEETRESFRLERERAVDAWPAFGKSNRGSILSAFGALISRAGMTRVEFREAGVAGRPAQAKPAAGTSSLDRTDRMSRSRSTERTQETHDEPPERAGDAPPLASARYQYVLAGSFRGVREFLESIDRFSYPARIEQVRLQLAGYEDKSGVSLPRPQPNAVPSLRLSFMLKLYFSDG